MTGTTTLQAAEAPGLARVTLSQPGKLNAVDLAMWRSLRAIFERLQAMPQSEAPRAVVVCGEGGNFAAGGDILEFAQFRFDEERLRHFHEDIVAPTLHAVLACDIPLVAQIEGVCLGAGFEIAACCDIRVCGQGSRFGAPIAKLGFPMAPDELEVLARIAEPPVLREMLLEARLLDAQAALRHGLVHTVVPDAEVVTETLQRATRIASLAPQAARINKISLRQLIAGGPTFAERHAHFAYADSADHREGVMAFIEKRAPVFNKP